MPNISLKINFKDGDKLFAKELNNNFNVIKEALKNVSSVSILGTYDTEEELIAAHPMGEVGDGYLVGYNFYIWLNNTWLNVGPLGPQGPSGPQGPKGDTGPATITVGSTTTVNAGESAEVTNTGTSSEAVLNFKIPQGPKGETGPQGPKGDAGATGASNSLSIGTVTSGATADAAIVGEAPNQVLNLVLPQGSKGETGPAGEQGPKGDTGVEALTYAKVVYADVVPDETYIASMSLNDFNRTPIQGEHALFICYNGYLAEGEITSIEGNTVTVTFYKKDSRLYIKGPQGPQGEPGITGDTLPIGAIIPYGNETAPSNWLVCDGSAVSRTTYSDLFAVIGTKYGEGDGSTTFNLPNIKGKVTVGYDSSDTDFNTIGKTGGEKTHTITTQEMAEHTHQFEYTTVMGTAGYNTLRSDSQVYSGNIQIGNTYSTGGGQAHNNLQPYSVANYIIKAFQSAGNVSAVSNTEVSSTTDTYSCNYINNKFTYSLEEQVVGKWIDGRKVYKKNGALCY